LIDFDFFRYAPNSSVTPRVMMISTNLTPNITDCCKMLEIIILVM